MRLSNRTKRMIVHQERNRAGVSLNLIPMIDILSVMVAFLLVYSTEVEVLQNTKGITIPESVAEQKPRVTVVIMVTPEELLVQGEPVAKIADIERMPGSIVLPLKAALERPTVAMPRSVLERDIAGRELTILGDKAVPFNVLNPSAGGLEGYSATSRRSRSNSATRPGAAPVAGPIWVMRKPPSGRGRKSSVTLELGALVEKRNFGWRAFETSKKKIPFCPFSTLRSPPQARTFLSDERWQWCGSFPTFPGGGTGTVRRTFP